MKRPVPPIKPVEPTPRRRGRPPELSIGQIVAVGRRQVGSTGGPESLNLRGIAAELGVTAMALYRYFEDKDDLLERITGELLDEQGLSAPPTNRTWKAWYRSVSIDLYELISTSPVAAHVYSTRPVTAPAAMRRMETALAVLLAAGFVDAMALETYTAIHTYTIGFATVSSSRRRQQPAGKAKAQSYWRNYNRSLPAEEYPTLTRLAPNLADLTSRATFEYGLERLLEQFDSMRNAGATG